MILLRCHSNLSFYKLFPCDVIYTLNQYSNLRSDAEEEKLSYTLDAKQQNDAQTDFWLGITSKHTVMKYTLHSINTILLNYLD